MPEQVDAVSRVVSYPLVRDSWSKFSEVYQRGKDGSRILRMCGSLAESSAMLAFNASQPVLSRLPVETVNSLAVQTLDEMEQKFPLMTKPTSEMVDSVKSYSLSKIDEAKSYGVDQFNRLADRTRLTSVLDFADVTVDTLLPAEHEADGDSAMAPAGPAEPAPVDASSKLRLISSKVRQRSYQRAMSRVKCLEKKSAETVGKLMYTVDLIDYAKRNLSGLSYEKTRNKVKDIYTEIVAEEENEPEMPETDMNMERKAIYAARRLTLRARSTFSSVSGLASALPEQTRDRLNQAVAYTESLYQSLSQIDSYKEISSQLIAQFREKLMYLQSVADSLTSTMAESSPIQWLASHLPENSLLIAPNHPAPRSSPKLQNDLPPPPKESSSPDRSRPRTPQPQEQALKMPCPATPAWIPGSQTAAQCLESPDLSVDASRDQSIDKSHDETVAQPDSSLDGHSEIGSGDEDESFNLEDSELNSTADADMQETD